MSGIGIIFHRDGRPVERDDLERMSRSLSIYGPEKRVIKSDGEIGFVYTHFTNTPEAKHGSQPLNSRNGRYTFVFDGRIDNRAEMAAVLGLEHSAIARMSDAALALAFWEKNGIDGLNQWVGEFAGIVWDREKRQVSLIRDHFGRRPLHFNLTDKRLIVASMPKGIHALGDIPRELDRTRLTNVLTQFDVDLTRSFFKDIDLVAPASVNVVGREKHQNTKYYALRDHIKPIRYARDADYVEAAEELFGNAMSACLRSPGRVGSNLSTGMDSSLITAHAARRLAESGERLSTYTWVPMEGFDQKPGPGQCYDESPAAQAMADMYPNIDTNLAGRDGPSIYDGLKEYMFAAEGVVRNTLNVSLMMETGRKAKADGVKVLLNGGHGNMTLSYTGIGAPYELFRRGKWVSLIRDIHGGRDPAGDWKRLALSVLPRRIVDAVRTAKNPKNTLENIILRRSAARGDVTNSRQIAERAQALNFDYILHLPKDDNDYWITFIENLSGPVEANLLAAVPALFGYETRDPFINRKLMEWKFGVPDTQFRRNGKTRFLMRRLMQGKVPSLMTNREMGIGVQSADWAQRLEPDLDRIRRELKAATGLASLSDIVDEDKILKSLDNFPKTSEGIVAEDLDDFAVLVPLTASVAALAVDQSGTNIPSIE